MTPGTGAAACRARSPLETLNPDSADPQAARTVQAAAACAGMTAEEQAIPLVDFVNLKVGAEHLENQAMVCWPSASDC
jgi:hypothetical protein